MGDFGVVDNEDVNGGFGGDKLQAKLLLEGLLDVGGTVVWPRGGPLLTW